MLKLAIIGASYLQEPLIQKAKSMGIETHVFAWAANDVGEKSADYFYPISIIEKETILKKCREIGIDGICSIASDLAMITVNYVASQMGLVGNSIDCTIKSTNKHAMRKAFEEHGDPSPKSVLVESVGDVNVSTLHFPIIVKPTDRSGSRGITKLIDTTGLASAIDNAKAQGFEKKALVEEFVEGQEYSVEYVSYQGKHQFVATTLKYTTGAPRFIETGHLQPAPVSQELLERVQKVVSHALDSLGIQNGASHGEIKIDGDSRIMLIEIGGRMGGDFIGSDLVELSTGVDFVRVVIDIALGRKPAICRTQNRAAAVRFVMSQEDSLVLGKIRKEHPEILVREEVDEAFDHEVTDSSSRFGYFLMQSDDRMLLQQYLESETVSK